MERRLLTVFGATGAQGGGLARAILGDRQQRFALRAVTRHPQGKAAVALAAQGAEVVAADLDDADSLRRVMHGAWGAFCVTNYWEHFSSARELAQARALAQAAAAEGIRHAVWSTLEDTRRFLPPDGSAMPMLQGRYNVPHFDAKGEADRFFTLAGVPTTFMRTSFYWDNFVHLGMGPQRGPDGRLVLSLPLGTAALPGIAAEDIGRCAFGIFAAGASWAGRTVGVAGEHLDGDAMAKAMASVLGQPVDYRPLAHAQYRALDFEGADDLGNMFQFKVQFEHAFRKTRDVATSRMLNPQLQDFARWLQASGRAMTKTL